MPNLETEFCGLHLKNPIIASSGTFGYGLEFEKIVDLNSLGGFVVKGLSRDPIEGNPPPRLVETASGMLNSIGLQNVGVRAFVAEKLPQLANLNTAVFANVFGYQPADYVEVIRILEDADGLAGYELNVSCPNTKHGGMEFASDPSLLSEVVGMAEKAAERRPLIVKLSPNVTDIALMARSAEEAGADAISLINTLVGMAVDVRERRPLLANVTGGLSGPAIKPVALAMTWKVRNAVAVPLIGTGGISTATDAIEFMIAGATCVQVGTATFVIPDAALAVVDGMRAHCEENGIDDINTIVGTLKT